MPFSDLLRPIYYLLIILKNNNPKYDFNLGVNLTQSNDPLSTNKIDSHFVNQTSGQNDMVQIWLPYHVGSKSICPNWQSDFFKAYHFGDFLTRKPSQRNHEL